MYFKRGLSLAGVLAIVGTLVIGVACGREETDVEDVANRVHNSANRADERLQIDIKLKDDPTALSNVSNKASVATATGQPSLTQGQWPGVGAQGHNPWASLGQQQNNPYAGHAGQYGANPFDSQRNLFSNQPGSPFSRSGNPFGGLGGQANPWLSHSAASAKPEGQSFDANQPISTPVTGNYGASQGYPFANGAVPGAAGFGAGFGPGFDPAFAPGFGPGASWLPGIFEAPLVINDNWDDDHHDRKKHHHEDDNSDDHNNDDH